MHPCIIDAGASEPAPAESRRAHAITLEPPRKEWRKGIKARPAKSEAAKLAVSLPAPPPLTLETLRVELDPFADRKSVV